MAEANRAADIMEHAFQGPAVLVCDLMRSLGCTVRLIALNVWEGKLRLRGPKAEWGSGFKTCI